MPIVSVIIPSFNCAKFVTNAVDSVLAQTFTDYEIIVIDDGSTDNTKDVLSSFSGRITYIYQENRGLPGARNAGIRASRGEWVALLDADDEWYPNKLEEQMRVVVSTPDVGFIFSDYNSFNDNGLIKEMMSITNQLTPLMGFKKQIRGLSYNSGACVRANIFQDLLLFGCCINTPTIFFKKNLAEQAGLFNESLRMCEDYEFWLRCSKGNDFCYLNKALAKYRINIEGMSGDGMQRNMRHAYGEAHAIELNWDIIPKEIRKEVKSRILELYFDAVWGSYRTGEYLVCVREAARSLKLNLFQLKIFIYLLLATLRLCALNKYCSIKGNHVC